VLLVSSTNLYLFTWRFTELRRHSAPYYLHQDQLDALAWLAQHTGKSDVVLAQPELGQFVPNYGGARAYLAHWAMTNRFFERRANVEKFFRPTPPDDWRERLLTSEHVTFVVRTDWPDAPTATFDPGALRGLELAFARPRAQVYRFRLPEFARRGRD
jgi:hypothetical protein